MKIRAVCRGNPEVLPGKKYKTGINKTAVSGPMMVDAQGLVGDSICNRKHHGGVEQAIYLEGSIDLAWWESELGRDLPPGTFGENLLVEGLDNRTLAAGDRFAIGDVLLEVTSPRMPCATFAARMGEPAMVKRYACAARGGAYCRVLKAGLIEAGQDVAVMPYDGERVSLPEMMATFGRSLSQHDRQRYLGAPINDRWKQDIRRAIS
ncbi:MOSC domain containing protein [Rhizobium sp. PDO1-076]|uniref:MOSC domain-containing protein n=1 Tax=Rhizobium sp. PDO1-076 TaxID=1125979 RepID=UPI00024E2B00|nr:MOSC domain-containing protein [Rhizobium sp. PDO1-076]EHS52483.1 MOSC domain containing protein [Rhizobium sp. PDO1-076]